MWVYVIYCPHVCGRLWSHSGPQNGQLEGVKVLCQIGPVPLAGRSSAGPADPGGGGEERGKMKVTDWVWIYIGCLS